MTGADATGLSFDDLRRETERFGVAEEQVRRDHVISHILATISEICADGVIFFGGTALSRTHLAHARLSEDIDLIATSTRADLLQMLVRALDRALMRTHGRPVWSPGFTDRDTDAAVVSTAGVQVKLQVLRGEHYSAWPVERVAVEQRYSDASPAALTVPTLASFAGWKTAAWNDRAAPRDLYDLWALDEIGALTAEAAELFARFGTTGHEPRPFMFGSAPSEPSWLASLGGQTRLTVTAEQALDAVRRGWSRAVGENWDQL
ncbi:nucleotidyl transferase AbiEii/AbiGii toxin family protein [Knoellia sp. CPCC 206453]|uniref:nucleotidyl transferase AbiEii/AbiGii toxin family protein n=1 Tax=Knoellia pratensis TaxID=3404796 RepID=UPI00360BD987